ncbi:MAG: hypothetical protein QW511_05080 [Candidatus Methanomethylicia archaeon]
MAEILLKIIILLSHIIARGMKTVSNSTNLCSISRIDSYNFKYFHALDTLILLYIRNCKL